MKVTINVDDGLKLRIQKALPGMSVEDVALRATRKAVADAELRAFAAAKQAEVEAEARRLNEELGGQAG